MKKSLLIALLLVAPPLAAQQKPAAPPPAARDDAAKALKALQDQIELTRKQRLELEAQAERTLSVEISQRASSLAMGGEAGALQRLEFLLDSAQQRLLVQRDRIRLLRDATVSGQSATTLVVLFRVDSIPAGELVAEVWMDGQAAARLSFGSERMKTLAAGAADEVYRVVVTPEAHRVLFQFGARGISAGETLSVTAAAGQVNYVEFVLKAGKITASTWTNRATPF